ncbi:MAG TPA: hypothetical protein VF519_08570 [Mycobacteriales bacterium]
MIRTKALLLDEIEPPSGRARRAGHLVVRESSDRYGYQIVSGHRTYERAVRARREGILCLVRIDDAGDAFDRIAEMQLGVYDPLEEAEILAETLTRTGLSQRALSRRTGLPQSRISRRLLLRRLPSRERKRLREGDLTIREALDLAMARRAR